MSTTINSVMTSHRDILCNVILDKFPGIKSPEWLRQTGNIFVISQNGTNTDMGSIVSFLNGHGINCSLKNGRKNQRRVTILLNEPNREKILKLTSPADASSKKPLATKEFVGDQPAVATNGQERNPAPEQERVQPDENQDVEIHPKSQVDIMIQDQVLNAAILFDSDRNLLETRPIEFLRKYFSKVFGDDEFFSKGRWSPGMPPVRIERLGVESENVGVYRMVVYSHAENALIRQLDYLINHQVDAELCQLGFSMSKPTNINTSKRADVQHYYFYINELKAVELDIPHAQRYSGSKNHQKSKPDSVSEGAPENVDALVQIYEILQVNGFIPEPDVTDISPIDCLESAVSRLSTQEVLDYLVRSGRLNMSNVLGLTNVYGLVE